MNIGLYSPYLDSLSGGERYVLTIASHWSKTHTVSIFWNDPAITTIAGKRFNVDLRTVAVKPNIFVRGNYFGKLIESRRYDCIVFLSDGSIPISFARRNILHFQVPFQRVLFPPWKRALYKHIVCNSRFTKDHIDPAIGSRARVIYPPVDVEPQKTVKKEPIILSVGRFSELKNQRVLISAFKEGYTAGRFPRWKLVMAGGLLPSDRKYYESLRLQARQLPVTFYPNIAYEDLWKLYATSAIFWHAAGFGQTKPENMEHFGITTVEAMAAGCIPVVVSAGGLKEIVTHGKDGYLWKNPKELIEYSLAAMTGEKAAFQKRAQTRALDFNVMKFCQSFDRLLV